MRVIKNEKEFLYQLTTMPHLFPINAYIVLEEKACTLIDCSKKGEGRKIITILQKIAETHPLKYIVLTHGHSDHVGDVHLVKEAFPKAQIAVSKTEFAISSDLFNIKPDILLDEDMHLGSLEVTFTPGHTDGSISLYDKRTNIIFVGDLLQSQGGLAIAGDTRILFPFPGNATKSLSEAICSTQKILKKYPKLKQLCFGHGNPKLNNEKIVKIIERAHNKSK